MRILLVQTSFLGDVILSTPVLGAVKQLYPCSELWTLTTQESEELLRRDPFISGRLVFDKKGADGGAAGIVRMAASLRAMRFDRAYILHRSARTALLMALSGIRPRIAFKEASFSFLHHQRVVRPKGRHEVLRNLSILSAEAEPTAFAGEIRLFAPRFEELAPARRELFAKLSRYLVLVPGSVWPTKMWHWQGYREVARHFLALGWQAVILGAAAEKQVAHKVCEGLPALNLAGETTISEVMYLVRHAALVVCNDSMALHLASGFKVPAVAVFCATSPAFGFGPWKNEALVVEENLPCRPCSRHGTRRCPLGTESCMRLPAKLVIEKAELLLAQSGAARKTAGGV